jgi:hypothetical protein
MGPKPKNTRIFKSCTTHIVGPEVRSCIDIAKMILSFDTVEYLGNPGVISWANTDVVAPTYQFNSAIRLD